MIRLLPRFLLVILLILPLHALAAPPLTPAQQAEVLGQQAFDFYGQKNWQMAAGLYRKAFLLSRVPEWLFGAARAEHQAGQLVEAKRDYEFVREMVGPKDPRAAKATEYIAEVEAALRAQNAPAPVTPVPAPKPVPPPKPAAMEVPVATRAREPKNVLAWTAVGVGTAALTTGIVVLIWSTQDQTTLNANRTADNRFDPSKITVDEARSQQSSINTRLIVGWALTGVGAAAAAYGAWAIATAPEDGGHTELRVLPTGSGFALLGKF